LRTTTLAAALAATLVLLAVACTPAGQGPTPAAGELKVVATTTVLADFVAHVGGDHVAVSSLVPKGGEVHTFDPAPADAARLADADMVVMNGLGLDDWLARLAQNAGQQDLPVLRLAEDLSDVELIEGGEEEDAGELAGAFNPHLWMDVSNARAYVDRIRLRLIELDPANQADYDDNAEDYDDALSTLDENIREQIAAIPADNRRFVAFHDAFPYFARAYGLEQVGVVVDAPGQDPSAGEVAALVDAINETNVKLIVAEVQFPDRLVRQIADETGATVESDLYTDTLGDPPLDSYEAMMRWDADRFVEGLR
jgi:ABC-type Zn uptake system ZnuABC Zn-binding protein ZnuA